MDLAQPPRLRKLRDRAPRRDTAFAEYKAAGRVVDRVVEIVGRHRHLRGQPVKRVNRDGHHDRARRETSAPQRPALANEINKRDRPPAGER